MKLSDKQRKHLQILLGGEKCAYPLLHIGTLNSLSLKGLVKANYGRLGAMSSPHTAITWRITEAGREVLAGLQ